MWCLYDTSNKKQTSVLHILESSWAYEKKKKFNKSDAMAAADIL